MDRALTGFVRALRLAGVAVSPAESIEAARAMALVGYGDRQYLKDVLGCVLAKSPDEKSTHDTLFDLYFSAGAPASKDTASKDKEDASSDSQQDGAAGDGGDDGEEQTGSFMDLAASGDENRMAVAMEQAAAAAGVDQIRFASQSGFLTRRMLEHLGVRQLEEELMDRFDGKSAEDKARAELLLEMRSAMHERARAVVDQRFKVFGEAATEAFMDEVVSEKALGQIDTRDYVRMKLLTAKLAKKLASKHSRRRKKAKRGKLDIRRTLRSSAAMEGVPFKIIWKREKKDRPRITVICDVSGSVAQYVRFLLMLLYSLTEVVPDIRTFAFSDRLHNVGPVFDSGLNFEQAMLRVLHTAGLGSTDYGQALDDLVRDHSDVVDRRTTVIIIGDGRSNYADPRTDLLREVVEKSKRTIWLSPEGRSSWGQGDSEMLRYERLVHATRHVATLNHLERVVDDVLSSYD